MQIPPSHSFSNTFISGKLQPRYIIANCVHPGACRSHGCRLQSVGRPSGGYFGSFSDRFVSRHRVKTMARRRRTQNTCAACLRLIGHPSPALPSPPHSRSRRTPDGPTGYAGRKRGLPPISYVYRTWTLTCFKGVCKTLNVFRRDDDKQRPAVLNNIEALSINYEIDRYITSLYSLVPLKA